MQETTTVNQLNKALNELLNAYDKLKYENKQINEKNIQLEDTIAELEEKNNGLETQISSLSDTTKHNSSEIDTMLGRIKSILDTTPSEENSIEEEVEDVINNEIYNEQPVLVEAETLEVETEEPKIENKPTENPNPNKEIDLGRMQSLLNGFN